MGYKDKDGYFYIVDRKKDLIIVNGMNVYPRVIEDVIYKYPSVAEVCVIGLPDKLHGEIPIAFVVVKEGKRVKKEEILGLCKKHLGIYEIPHKIEFVSELPKTSTGKIDKKLLRSKFIT